MSFLSDVAQSSKRVTLMFDFILDKGPLYLWNGAGDLEFEEIQYKGESHMEMSIAIVQSLETNAIQSSINFQTHNSEFILIARNENYQNRPVKVFFVSLTEDWQVSNRVLLMEGKLENIDLNYDVQEIRAQVTIQGPSRFLRNTVNHNYSKADQNILNPTDTFFNFIIAAKTNPPPWSAKKT